MALPAIEAERWRLVEQKLSEFGVDIQRLWRQFPQSQVGGPAQSGALTPEELAALTGAGTGGGDTVRVYTLAIAGNVESGTISWEAVNGGTTVTGTFGFDDSAADVDTALSTFDASVVVEGGDLPYNAVKIKFSSDASRLRITSYSLVREEFGAKPIPELSYCFEPA